MGDKSAIEWCDATWNPTVGCSIVSPGCTNCYAMKEAARMARMSGDNGRGKYAGLTSELKPGKIVWNGTVRLYEGAIDQPLRWKKPRRIFVNSMSDLFHEDLPDAAIDKVFAIMALAPQHTFQVLTKRAERMRAYMNGENPLRRLHHAAAADIDGKLFGALRPWGNIYSLYLAAQWPLPNVWLGVSVEDQKRADERIPHLLATPARVRFLSYEPALGPVDLTWIAEPDNLNDGVIDALLGRNWIENPDGTASLQRVWRGGERHVWRQFVGIKRPNIDWVIAGGESGPDARPMHPDWARSLRDQCAAAGVPFFFKQWGVWAPTSGGSQTMCFMKPRGSCGGFFEEGFTPLYKAGKRRAGRLLDGREHNEFPA